jgi:hypothetical protein
MKCRQLIWFNIALNCLVVASWLTIEPLSRLFYGSPLAGLSALVSLQVLLAVRREFGLAAWEQAAWGLLLVASYPLAFALCWLQVNGIFAGLPVLGGDPGLSLIYTLLFPATQTVVLIVFNAMLRGWGAPSSHGQALGSAA